MVSYKHIPTIYFPREKNQKDVKIIFTQKYKRKKKCEKIKQEL